jgi:hypothetical protein
MAKPAPSQPDDGSSSRMRSIWAGLAALFLLPLIAMAFTEEVAWGLGDFAVFGAMLIAAGLACALGERLARKPAHRAMIGAGVAAVFVLVWLQLAVGIVDR